MMASLPKQRVHRIDAIVLSTLQVQVFGFGREGGCMAWGGIGFYGK